jgi:hypothetical protein
MAPALQAGMRPNIAIILAGLSIQALGCTSAPDETYDLVNSGADGKTDSIAGKRLSAVVTEDVQLQLTHAFDTPTTYRGTIEAKTIDGQTLEVQGPKLVVAAGVDRRASFRVKASALDVFTKLKFVVRVHDKTSQSWKDLTLTSVVTPVFGDRYPVSIDYFDYVLLDPQAQTIDFPFGSMADVAAPFVGLSGRDLEYTLFVFPESGWGSLDGSYDFTLEVHVS